MRARRPISENTHTKLLRELGVDAVTHGFRQSLRDYAAEQTHKPHAAKEAALAHYVQEGRARIRAQATCSRKRHELMAS